MHPLRGGRIAGALAFDQSEAREFVVLLSGVGTSAADPPEIDMKSVLISVPTERPSLALIDAAISLAKAFDAKLDPLRSDTIRRA